MFDLGLLEDLAAKLAVDDERVVPDEELLARARSIEKTIGLLAGANASTLSELDVRGTTVEETGHRTAMWLAHETGCSTATAKQRLRLGHTLRSLLPETAAALADGRLCPDRARVMAGAVNDRIATEFADMEAAVIEASGSMTFRAFEQHVQLVAALLDQDGPAPGDDVCDNQLHLKGAGGDTRVSGRLYGDLAVVARQAIEQMADELFRQFRDDRDRFGVEIDIPPRKTLLALALAELCRRGLMVTTDGTPVTTPKAEATLVFSSLEPDVPYADGQPVLGDAAGVLGCDVSVWTVICNSLGVPLDMGREIRSANRAQRRAMQQRDGGCVFPGCEASPEWCDAHHIAHWRRDLGTTDVGHMVFLCRHHHRVLHRPGWNLSIGDDGWSWITTPYGRTRWCQRHGHTRTDLPPPPVPPPPRPVPPPVLPPPPPPSG